MILNRKKRTPSGLGVSILGFGDRGITEEPVATTFDSTCMLSELQTPRLKSTKPPDPKRCGP